MCNNYDTVKKMNKDELFLAIQNTNPAQRNYDLTKTIPDDHIQLMLDAIKYAPTKQNETHYKIYWSTNRSVIEGIYSRTKYFSVVDETVPMNNKGNTPEEYCVTNSQINANLLVAFCSDWDQSRGRARDHIIVDDETRKEHVWTHIMKNRIMDISAGIAIGQLLLTANLLGYRTGCCSAFKEYDVLGIENTFTKCIVGIGYPNSSMDRKIHPDVLNKDILAEKNRTGSLDELWSYPTFEKSVQITNF
jgi:nitroreductase